MAVRVWDWTAQLLQLDNGLKLYTPLEAAHLLCPLHEPHLYKILEKLEPQTPVVDVGAFTGPVALRAAAKGHKVYTYEPDPRAALLLETNTEINRLQNLVKIHASPALDKKEKTQLYLSPIPGRTSIYAQQAHSRKAIETTAITIDETIDDDPTLIKIDVEGAAHKTIQGAKQTIKRAKPLIYIETHNIQELTQTIKTLQQLNYKPHLIIQNTRTYIIAKPKH